MLKKRLFILLKLIAYFFIDNFADIYFLLFHRKIEKSNKILIIGDQQIGDFILSLNSLKEYKGTFKNNKIVLLCNENLVDLARKTNYFDEIISINTNKIYLGNSFLRIDFSLENFIYRFKKLLELKKINYKKILNPTNLFYVSMLIKNLNAEEKIGVFDKNKYLGNFFNIPYTTLVKLDLKNELNDFAKFFRIISGQKKFLSGLPTFDFEIPKYEKLAKNYDYCAVSLSGSFYEKNWDIKNFLKSLEKINFEIDIVLVGSNTKNEINSANQFLKLYKGKNKVINFVGKTTLMEYISIIKYSKFAFGNDSSIIHIAVASKIPSICITSGHSFEYCVPYFIEKNLTEKEKNILPISIFHKMDCFGCGLICNKKLTKNKKFQCVDNIEVSKVISALNNIININKN
ncbi:MAG: hypothetical protein LBF97_02285 [Elusimicrobiota bacterium]|jgi:ADP-heptose:LPS heptosyltransferase|nr:hypothetical protein [Elusimicrobiota bacterium]